MTLTPKQKEWGHDELANDLASHFKNGAARLIWQDMQLGPSGSPRPDVYVIPKTYFKFNPAAYEVKVSRSDFLSDIKSGKWQTYYKYAKTVTFAVPDGLIKKTELPDGAGLMVRKDKVWRNAKRATVQHLETLPHMAWMKLLIDGVDRATAINRTSFFEDGIKLKIIKEKLGSEISDMIKKGNFIQYEIKAENEARERQKEKIKETMRRRAEFVKNSEKQASQLLDEVCEIVGLPSGSHPWDIQRAVTDLRTDVNADARVKELTTVIEQAGRSLEKARIVVSAPLTEREGE